MQMKTSKLNLLLIPFLMVLSGCLTSEAPFCDESELLDDDRLVGTYREGTNQPSWFIEKQLGFKGRYIITFAPENQASGLPCSMRFNGALFQVGTNRFLDMMPIMDACDYIPANPPSPIEILQKLTLQPLHLVVKVDASTNAVGFSFADQQGLMTAARQAPEFFRSQSGQLPRMVADTKRQREFLLRFGGDTNVFKPSVIRRDIKPSK
jgi:hypothetical protein